MQSAHNLFDPIFFHALAERLLAFCLLEGHVQGTTLEGIGGRLRNNDAEGIVQMVHMDNGVGRDGRRCHRQFTGAASTRPFILEQACPSFSHVFAADVTHLWLLGWLSSPPLNCTRSHTFLFVANTFAFYLDRLSIHRWFVCQYSPIVSRQSPTPRSAARGRSSSALRPRSLSNSSSRCSNTVSFLTNLPFMCGIGIVLNWCRPVEAATVVFLARR